MIRLFYKTKINYDYDLYDYIIIKVQNKDKHDKSKIEEKLICFLDSNSANNFIAICIKYLPEDKSIFKILSKNDSAIDEQSKFISELQSENIVETSRSTFTNANLTIGNIEDYILICRIFNERNTLYRGQSKERDLKPTIFRNHKDINKEKELYENLIQWNDEKFCSDNFIENACNMQHYGIPTRLMDWTSNATHALYFACSGNNDSEDGQVLMINGVEIHDIDSEKCIDINSFLKHRYTLKSDEDTDKAFFTLTTYGKEYLFFKTKYSNNRIRNQQGYFSIYIDLTEKEAKKVMQKAMEKILEDIYLKIKRGRNSNNIISDEEYDRIKHRALSNMDRRETLAEYISNVARMISEHLSINKSKEDIEVTIEENMKKIGYGKIVERENNMQQILEEEQYVNIIIPKNLKRKLLEVLDSWGVSSRSIYPDIEGLSKYMKEKYQ